MKDERRKFRGLEIAMDNIRLEEQLIPEGESIKDMPCGNTAYFKKYGFKVSEVFNAIYSKANGIVSDKYIPASLYFYYISPYLMNMNLTMAYVDKNAYEVHFPDAKQPETILKNINGSFVTHWGGLKLTIQEVLNELSQQNRFIIKPSIESGRGRDVMLAERPFDDDMLMEILDKFGSDYIIQKVVRQHPELSKLNKTSLNTCRVYTYQPILSDEIVVLGAAVRFGGEGAYRDNACTGGGFCKVHGDGRIDDRICQYRFWDRRSLKEEKGLENIVFPSYDKVIKLCKSMHARLPYMNLVGWDIAVDDKGDPVLIELNQYPDCEFIQLFNGPMFGDYTDELMEAISNNETEFVTVAKRSFPRLSSHHDYNFEIGKKYSI